MKTNITTVIFILTSLSIYSQVSFEKKANIIAFGADLGVYQYTSKTLYNNLSSTTSAANKTLSLLYERAILNWLGVGAKIGINDYFTSVDSITHTKPAVQAIDATVLVNAHFVRSKHVDLLAGFNVGYSNLNYEARDASISSAKGGGLMFDLHFQPRFYFGKHIGMFINLAYINYNYQNLDFQNTSLKVVDVLQLKGGGVNFGLGIQGKF